MQWIVVDIAHMGRPRAIEERRLATHAVFAPGLMAKSREETCWGF